MIFSDSLAFLLWSVVALVSVASANASLADSRQPAVRFARSDVAYFLAVVLALLSTRMGILFYRAELNIDECQFIAQALGYHRDLTPFTQDGHTCGPLNYYVLMWPAYLNLPITYFTIRVTGFVLVLVTILGSVRTLSHILDSRWAKLVCLPLVTFYCFAYQPGFVHFSSEHFPEALLAVAAMTVASLWKTGKVTVPGLLLLGLILGALPFTKLQASPLALYLFIVAAVLLVRGRRSVTEVLALILGCVVVPAILGAALLAHGTLGDSFYRYVIVNATYGAQLWIPDPHPLSYVLYEFARNGPQFTVYLIDLLSGAAVFAAIAIRFRDGKPDRGWLTGVGVLLGFWVVGCWSVLKPGQAFCHYLLFLPVPTLLLFAWIARGFLLQGRPDTQPARHRAFLIYLLVISFLALPLYLFEQHALPYLTIAPSAENQPVDAYIKSVTGPNDVISNWGYNPQYYVDTQLPPGVRDYSTLFELFPGTQNDYFRNGYLDDLKQNRPKVIVDSVSEHYLPTWVHPLDRARAAAWPPLADYLAQHYRPAVEITPSPGNPPVLIYVRND